MSFTRPQGAAGWGPLCEQNAPPSIELAQDLETSIPESPHCHVTIKHECNSFSEITILLESTYLQSQEEGKQPSDDGEEVECVQQLQELQGRVVAMEQRHKEAMDSLLNREDGLRAAIEAVAEVVRDYTDNRLQRFERA